MIPPDFSVQYEYLGASFRGSAGYALSLKTSQDGRISEGEKTTSFPVKKEKLEEIFGMLARQNFFRAEPFMVERLKNQLSSLFGVGGAQVRFQAQADGIVRQLPPLPLTVRESNINYARILRIQGLPADITKEILEEAVAEAKGLARVFKALWAIGSESGARSHCALPVGEVQKE